MANSNQRTGKAYIYIDGTLYETLSGAKLSNINSMKRDPVIGSAVYGYAETAQAPELDCSFAHGPGISAAALGAITNSSIQFECDSGPIFTLTGAFLAGDVTMDVDKHAFDCKFMATACTEMMPTA